MNKKIKIFFCISISVLSIYIAANVMINNKRINSVDLYSDNDRNVDLEYVTVQEIRDTKDTVIEELRNGRFENLVSDDIYVRISDEDEVSNMYEHEGELCHGITDPMELYNKEMEIIRYYLGDDLSEEHIWDANTLYQDKNGYWELRTNQEVLEKLKEGRYEEINTSPCYGYALPQMAYSAWTNDENDNRYAHISANFDQVAVIRGKLMELWGEKHEDPESYLEPLKVYYPGAANTDDVYRLQNGEISIRDAIEFVEDYFKNQLPYDISSGAEKRVAKVGVYEVSEGNICLEFTIVRMIQGMETEYGQMYGPLLSTEYTDEACRAMMVEVGDIDEYILLCNTLKNEPKGKKVNKVVSLLSALECVSGKIGKNSRYLVTEARMAYRKKIITDCTYKFEFMNEPCWIIRCVNQTDMKETVFYINLINGKLDYVTNGM